MFVLKSTYIEVCKKLEAERHRIDNILQDKRAILQHKNKLLEELKAAKMKLRVIKELL